MVPEYEEELKGMASAMENICWFFGQVLFVGGAGALLVQSTLKDLGYEVTLGKLALVEVPVALVALISASIYFYFKKKKDYVKILWTGGTEMSFFTDPSIDLSAKLLEVLTFLWGLSCYIRVFVVFVIKPINMRMGLVYSGVLES